MKATLQVKKNNYEPGSSGCEERLIFGFLELTLGEFGVLPPMPAELNIPRLKEFAAFTRILVLSLGLSVFCVDIRKSITSGLFSRNWRLRRWFEGGLIAPNARHILRFPVQ